MRKRAIQRYLLHLFRRVRDQRDIRLINARANITNRESDALFELQSWPP